MIDNDLREKIADVIDEAISLHSDCILCDERSSYAGNEPYDQTDKIMDLIDAYLQSKEQLRGDKQ